MDSTIFYYNNEKIKFQIGESKFGEVKHNKVHKVEGSWILWVVLLTLKRKFS